MKKDIIIITLGIVLQLPLVLLFSSTIITAALGTEYEYAVYEKV